PTARANFAEPSVFSGGLAGKAPFFSCFLRNALTSGYVTTSAGPGASSSSIRSRRTRATRAGPPSRSRIGTGSRPRRARQPDGKRGGAPTGGAGVRRFITTEAYRKKQTSDADARKNFA